MKDDLVVQRKTRRPKRLRARRPPTLHVAEILAWADAWFERSGRWPMAQSGHIPETTGERWNRVELALRQGLRGLPGGWSLARLLAERRGKRNRGQLPPYSSDQILVWADAHHARTGRWPNHKSGSIPEAPGETWMAVQGALRQGMRGLPGGSSLRRLLARRRGVRNKSMLPRLSVQQILAWADAWFQRTGRWPEAESGYIPGTNGEKWMNVNSALAGGFRGLPGGSTLARLLAEQRGKRNRRELPTYSTRQILAWADAHHVRTGRWPNYNSGAIPEAPGETWAAVNMALRQGVRGLPGGSSLPRLLARRRGVRNHMMVPPLSIEQILAWADAHYARTGRWPSKLSGPIPSSRGDTWSGVNGALRQGQRGLPGGSSLPRLLAEQRGAPNRFGVGPFTIEQILAWADAHFERTGRWPNTGSGPIAELPWATWRKVDEWLRTGARGLPGGKSLLRLLRAHRQPGAVSRKSAGRDGAAKTRSIRRRHAK